MIYGVEEIGGMAHIVIDRNTTIPTRQSKLFTTDVDNATEIKFTIYKVKVLRHDPVIAWDFYAVRDTQAPKEVPEIELTLNMMKWNINVTG